MQIAIIGTGYVGLTTGACLAAIGHEVTCLDSDPAKIETLRQGRVPIYEPFIEEILEEAEGRLRFTQSYAEAIPSAQVVFIAVGTPPMADGSPDLQFLRSAAAAIGEQLGDGFTVVVNKSTVPIGSGNWVESLIREASAAREGRAPAEFAVASNPEFLREGSALQDSLYPDRIVVGADSPRALDVLTKLYRPILEQSFTPPGYLRRPDGIAAVPLVTTDLASAELIKYAANSFLALKISFINEIGRVAEKVGADVTLVAKGIGLDRRIGTRFLQAGLGWGGSCFAKDTAALVSTAADYSLTMPIVSAARLVNQTQRERVVEKLLAELKIMKGKTVGLLGLAFKPNTDDLRDAPSLDIARALIARGATVVVHDPVAMPRARIEQAGLAVRYCESAEQVAEHADALVLVTEW
ncbi:MAG: UDP-glucose/GDP-mannose dehydrogenase family protein, partial [Acidobacteriota bacterium]